MDKYEYTYICIYIHKYSNVYIPTAITTHREWCNKSELQNSFYIDFFPSERQRSMLTIPAYFFSTVTVEPI